MTMLKDRSAETGMNKSVKMDARIFRRGASNAMDAMKVPDDLQERLGTWVRGSQARKKYKTPIRHDARNVQQRLLKMPQYIILTDDVGFLREPLGAATGVYRDDAEVVHHPPTASAINTTQWGLSRESSEPSSEHAPPRAADQPHIFRRPLPPKSKQS